MAQLLFAAAHRSSGKTTITAGVCATLRRRGLTVQPFKKGPDYIDPMWLTMAAGRTCDNLDFHTMGEAEMLSLVARRTVGADVAVIEANKGLFDGLDPEGGDSSAALAALLGSPVVLVVEARGMTRGVAPLLLGYQAFAPDLRIAGVILNKVGGARHEAKLRAAVERYTDLPVFGAVARDAKLEITERHLGLVPSIELTEAEAKVETIARAVAAQVDVERLLEVARMAPAPAVAAGPAPAAGHRVLRLGIVRDSAFGFYYPGDLEALRAAGAGLVPIDALEDARLPDVDVLFIGGGFPETHMLALEANASLRAEVRDAIEAGMPAYAECGGLMYLSRAITWQGVRCEMAGVIPAETVMHATPQGRGYVRLAESADFPWPAVADGGGGAVIPAHEFHYSSLEGLDPDCRFAFDVLRGAGVDGRHDGIVHKNLLAGFAHLRDTAAHRWARRFVAFALARRDAARASRAG